PIRSGTSTTSTSRTRGRPPRITGWSCSWRWTGSRWTRRRGSMAARTTRIGQDRTPSRRRAASRRSPTTLTTLPGSPPDSRPSVPWGPLIPTALPLSQRERESVPFSLWERGRGEGSSCSLACYPRRRGAAVDDQTLAFTSAVDLRRLIADRTVSPVEVVEALLRRIDRINPIVNAVCTVAADQALEAARGAEAAVQRDDMLGPLH